MKRKLYFIIIRNECGMTGGEYWREPTKSEEKAGKILGDWVKTKEEASKIPSKRADIYIKDWAKYGAKKELVRLDKPE